MYNTYGDSLLHEILCSTAPDGDLPFELEASIASLNEAELNAPFDWDLQPLNNGLWAFDLNVADNYHNIDHTNNFNNNHTMLSHPFNSDADASLSSLTMHLSPSSSSSSSSSSSLSPSSSSSLSSPSPLSASLPTSSLPPLPSAYSVGLKRHREDSVYSPSTHKRSCIETITTKQSRVKVETVSKQKRKKQKKHKNHRSSKSSTLSQRSLVDANLSASASASSSSSISISISTPLEDPVSQLIQAARVGDLDRVRHLTDGPRGLTMLNLVNCSGSALHAAVFYNREHVVRHLLLRGADANIRNVSGLTPLQKAFDCDHLHLVPMLLANGADPNVRDVDGLAILHRLVDRRNFNALQCLLQHAERHRIDVNIAASVNYERLTPLHLAAANNELEIATLLIEHGAALDALAMLNVTPLHKAVAANHIGVTRLLLRAARNNHVGMSLVDARDSTGRTALHWAAYYSRVECARLLVDLGEASLFVRDNRNLTPVDLARSAAMREYLIGAERANDHMASIAGK